jgi:alpha-ketoglutarate-dependent taurine dioxygenase
MNIAIAATVDVVPLSKYIGAEIRGIDLRTALDADTTKQIHQAWLDHSVLLFRNQSFSQEDLLRVTGYFGELAPLTRPAKFFPKGYARLLPNIMMISNIRENGETIGALPHGEMHFHHDQIHSEVPHNGTLLYSLEVPGYGGDTLFASAMPLTTPLTRRSSRSLPAGAPSTITTTARPFAAIQGASRHSAKRCIRCSEPMTRLDARRSMSIGS